MRHGHRERTLTGAFGKTRIAVPRARLTGEDGKTREWRSGSLRACQRRTRAADALIAGAYLAGAYLAGTNTRRVRGALNAVFAGPVGKDVVSRVWRKPKGDWDAWNARSLAEEPIVRLILDGTVARVRLDRRATSISLLVARGAWRARRRSEDAARDQEHGRGRRGGLACAARRSGPARIANAGAGRHRRRTGPRKGGGGAVARHGCPTLHRAQASQSPRPRARAPARGNLERLPRHDLRRDATRGEVETRRKAFFRKWRLKCRAVADSLEEAGDRLFTFTRFPPSQWKSIRTSNAIERLHEEFKRPINTQTVPPCAETAARLFWALLASGQITMRKVDGWQTLAEKPDDQSLTSPHDRIASCRPKTRQSIPTEIATGPPSACASVF